MQPGQEPVEDGSLRLEVEALDVEHPAVAGLHQHRYPTLPGRLADQELHVERVALLDHQVQPVEEGAQVLGGDALGDRHHPQVGVDLADPAGRHDRLVHPQVEDAARDAVEVGQLDVVEVGQPELAGQALHGQDVGDAVAGAQPDHPDPQGALAGLLGPGDLVAVAVEPQRPERTRSEEAHHGTPPGVVDPALGLVLEGLRGGRDDAGELLALLGQPVDHLAARSPRGGPGASLVGRVLARRAPAGATLSCACRLGRHRAVVDAVGARGPVARASSRRASSWSGVPQFLGTGAAPLDGDGPVALVGERDRGGAEHAGPVADAEGQEGVGDAGDGVLRPQPVHGVGDRA